MQLDKVKKFRLGSQEQVLLLRLLFLPCVTISVGDNSCTHQLTFRVSKINLTVVLYNFSVKQARLVSTDKRPKSWALLLMQYPLSHLIFFIRLDAYL